MKLSMIEVFQLQALQAEGKITLLRLLQGK